MSVRPATRVGDRANCPNDSHGNSDCDHNATGPAVSGSPNVRINGRPALRIGDHGIHSKCCGPNTWENIEGSGRVFINNIPAVRLHDATRHCGGIGKMIEGSSDVFFE